MLRPCIARFPLSWRAFRRMHGTRTPSPRSWLPTAGSMSSIRQRPASPTSPPSASRLGQATPLESPRSFASSSLSPSRC
jgi:hypothetical protein